MKEESGMAMKLNIRTLLTPIIVVTALAIAAPTWADDQHSRRGGNERGGQQGGGQQGGGQRNAPPPQAARQQAQPRGTFQPRMTAAPPQQAAPVAQPQQQSRSAFLPRMAQQAQPQQAAPQVRQGFPGARSVGPQAGAPQSQSRFGQAVPRGVPQGVQGGSVAPRGAVGPQAVGPRNGYNGYAVPRGSVAPRYVVATPGHGHYYGGGHYYYGGHYYGYYGYPYYYAAPIVVGRPYYAYPYGYYPYYAFHPHFSISFGFSVGYPVAYPTWYNPYAVGTFGLGVAYGASYGGISFDMQPYDAAVFIDGRYVGAAYDFGPQAAPLTLRSGVHHVELRAENCEPLAFDVTVVPNQVIPYQGTMPVVR